MFSALRQNRGGVVLADRQRLARFLRIPMTRIPPDPEVVDHPKEFLVNLARRSRARAIREDMVPTQQSGRQVGMEVILPASLSARFVGPYSFRKLGYVLQSARVLGALDYSV